MSIPKPLFLILLMALVAACGFEPAPVAPGPAMTGDNDTDSVDEDRSDGEILAELTEDVYRTYNAATVHNCQCAHDDFGYDDEQQCVDDWYIDDYEIAESTACIEETTDDEPPPSDTFDNYVECRRDSQDEVETCIADAEDDHGDHCSDELVDELHECMGTYQERYAACRKLNRDIEQWRDDFDDEIGDRDCFN